jgi:hypothetical protein
MPSPAFEYKLDPETDNWMRDFFWDSWADELFMSQNINTPDGPQTIKINRLGQKDRNGVRHFISAMTLRDAGQIMPRFQSDTVTVQAKLDPLGEHIAYRLSGNGKNLEIRRTTRRG